MLFIPLSGVNMRRIFSQFWFHEINPIWTSLRLWALAHKSYYNLASRIELIIRNLSTYNNKAQISLLWAAGRPKGNSIFALALASDLITKVEAGCTVQSSWRIAALLYLGYPNAFFKSLHYRCNGIFHWDTYTLSKNWTPITHPLLQQFWYFSLSVLLKTIWNFWKLLETFGKFHGSFRKLLSNSLVMETSNHYRGT